MGSCVDNSGQEVLPSGRLFVVKAGAFEGAGSWYWLPGIAAAVAWFR
jgi:hypothetical protein